jgi:cholesterol transport system auxiliary component
MRNFLIVVTLSLLGIGCTPNARQPAVHDFGQDAGKATTASLEQKPAINVDAPSWLWDNRIRYRLLFAEPSQVRFYGHDVWIASPPELFQQKLIASSNAFNYRLLVRLQTFEQQFDTADKARVLLNFSVEAYSVDNKNKIATQEFRLEQSSKTLNAQGAIDGFTDLTTQAVNKIQIWLAGLTAR